MQEAPAEAVDPFDAGDQEDRRDKELVSRAQSENSAAIEALVRRHQRFLFNIAVRMLYHPQDAEDATQEILIKVVTKLSTFEGRSRFRTWLYRIATNHLLNVKRGRMEPETMTFSEYGHGLDDTPELDLPDPKQVPGDLKLLVDEARIGCTTGLLLCLDREQRLVYVLGDILGATDAVGAELLEISREAFRQRLTRARRDLQSFLNGRCGLFDKANRCRCDRKTRGYMRAGYVDPENLLFAHERVTAVREVAEARCREVDGYSDLVSEIYRSQPFYETHDLAARVRETVDSPEFRKTFEV